MNNLWQITTDGTVIVQNVRFAIANQILQLLQTTWNLPGLAISQMEGN